MADEVAEPEVEEDEDEGEDEEEEEEEAPAYKHHAMFPRDDDGPETRDIVWIQLLRMLPDGTVQTCPDQFQASDLPHWGEVYRRFGGGKYRALGRNAKMQWQAASPGGSDWHVFDGASKPFAVNPVEVAAPPAPPPAPAPPPPPPAPPAPSGPTLAEAIVGLGGVLSSVVTALVNRPAAPLPPAPDNSLTVAMMNNMAAQASANQKSTTDVLVALLTNNKPDNSAMVAVLNASAETARAQAASQSALMTAVLTKKEPALADLADTLTKLARASAPQSGGGGMKDTIETIKAVQSITGGPAAASGSEFSEVTSLVTSLAALKDKDSGSKDEPQKPPPRRNRIMMRTPMG